LRLRCTRLWIVCPDMETGTTSFLATRYSHSGFPTSSKLNAKSTQQSCTGCLRHSTIVSRNDQGISSREFSWGRPVVWKRSVIWRIKQDSSHPSVTAAPRASQQ
jgi:hypothetical protein